MRASSQRKRRRSSNGSTVQSEWQEIEELYAEGLFTEEDYERAVAAHTAKYGAVVAHSQTQEAKPPRMHTTCSA